MNLTESTPKFFQQDENAEKIMPRSSSFINAFQLIAMSHDLDLSGLFEEEVTEHFNRSSMYSDALRYYIFLQIICLQNIYDRMKTS